jgi:alkyl hydroperoxide reductase subunit AhpF
MSLFRADEEEAVRELLGAIERPVELALVLGPEEQLPAGMSDIDFSAETRKLLDGIAKLSDSISVSVHEAPAFGAERFPAVCVLPEGRDVGIRFYGLPWGYELGSLVGVCLEAGSLQSKLDHGSLAALEELDRDLAVEVYVTPT